jgi:hypothetical protein
MAPTNALDQTPQLRVNKAYSDVRVVHGGKNTAVAAITGFWMVLRRREVYKGRAEPESITALLIQSAGY